ncbi:GNAT family N-acetyltransferase [Arenimonas sp. GDDSR-1]|uniref:GNAT family N-acetyltransferase n=1 Tax=Arenimonas sp. GDDSR-1 TaxID=2950125 RepID=UPI00260D3811|nr:GNAT family N-acetyltransferase [Arenimonas sp. GDDSR-1]
MSLQIRPARAEDAALLARWAQAMALETENKILPDAEVRPGIARGIADPTLARYFVAERDGVPAGTLMFTFEWSDWRNGLWWWIQSVYVPPEFRRQGIYRALYAHVRALAQADAGVCGIRLYVEKDNRSARSTYQALGMQDAHYRIYEQDTRPPGDPDA